MNRHAFKTSCTNCTHPWWFWGAPQYWQGHHQWPWPPPGHWGPPPCPGPAPGSPFLSPWNEKVSNFKNALKMIMKCPKNAQLSDAQGKTLWNALNASIALMLWCWLALGKAKPKSSTLKKKILLQSPVCTEHVSADGVSHRAPLRVLTSQSVHMGAHRNILKTFDVWAPFQNIGFWPQTAQSHWGHDQQAALASGCPRPHCWQFSPPVPLRDWTGPWSWPPSPSWEWSVASSWWWCVSWSLSRSSIISFSSLMHSVKIKSINLNNKTSQSQFPEFGFWFSGTEAWNSTLPNFHHHFSFH